MLHLLVLIKAKLVNSSAAGFSGNRVLRCTIQPPQMTVCNMQLCVTRNCYKRWEC